MAGRGKRWASDGGELENERVQLGARLCVVLYSRVMWACDPRGDRSPVETPHSFLSSSPNTHNAISPYSHALLPPTFPNTCIHIHRSLKIPDSREVKPHSFRNTLLHAEHSQLCTLTPFQGVGSPINTTLQGLRDWATRHKMLSGDWYTLVFLFLSSGYCLSLCLPSWKVRMVTFPQRDWVGLCRAVVNLTCLCIHLKGEAAVHENHILWIKSCTVTLTRELPLPLFPLLLIVCISFTN